MKRALVLAGGGVAGIAWESGVLRGIQEIEPELYSSLVAADVILGTSAGAAVAAQITSRTPLGELYDAQLGETTSELEVDLDLKNLMARFAEATAGATTAEEAPTDRCARPRHPDSRRIGPSCRNRRAIARPCLARPSTSHTCR